MQHSKTISTDLIWLHFNGPFLEGVFENQYILNREIDPSHFFLCRNIVTGEPPSARVKFAFTAVGNLLFCYGGQFYSSISSLAGKSDIKFQKKLEFH